ncbi:glutathione S-transferase family protein [Alphaproteobacteria bacterium]|nr:glutathione S-transferase family protein [Alphaproteobacteria bacterium]
MTLTFYYAKNSAAYAPHILLEDVGAEYEAIKIDFVGGEQRAAPYLKINPKGRVPSLITDQGILTETPAILAYIAQTHLEHAMAPETAFEFAVAQAFNCYIASTVHVVHAHKHRGARWADDASAHEHMRAKVHQNMTDCAAVIETHYLQGPWVLGNHYSMCDPYLALVTRWLSDDGVDVAQFPKIAAHNQAMRERPSMQTILRMHA